MTKLLSAIIAGLFAVASVSPAFAAATDDKKDEKGMEKKDAAKKKTDEKGMDSKK
jgi:hypothetical protein